MTNLLNALLVIILMLNLFTLGTSRIQSIIRTVAIQGILLGFLPLVIHEHLNLPVVLAALTAIILKGFVIPIIMSHALRDAQIKREVEPLIGILALNHTWCTGNGVCFDVCQSDASGKWES